MVPIKQRGLTTKVIPKRKNRNCICTVFFFLYWNYSPYYSAQYIKGHLCKLTSLVLLSSDLSNLLYMFVGSSMASTTCCCFSTKARFAKCTKRVGRFSYLSCENLQLLSSYRRPLATSLIVSLHVQPFSIRGVSEQQKLDKEMLCIFLRVLFGKMFKSILIFC